MCARVRAYLPLFVTYSLPTLVQAIELFKLSVAAAPPKQMLWVYRPIWYISEIILLLKAMEI